MNNKKQYLKMGDVIACECGEVRISYCGECGLSGYVESADPDFSIRNDKTICDCGAVMLRSDGDSWFYYHDEEIEWDKMKFKGKYIKRDKDNFYIGG